MERVTDRSTLFSFMPMTKSECAEYGAVTAKTWDFMAYVLRNPILAKIDDRANYLRAILQEYPHFLRDWEEKTEKDFRRIAMDSSDGDSEVELSIFKSLCSAFDYDDDRKNIFYQSVFLMCYSYYESCVAVLAKESNAKELIKAIYHTKNAVIPEELASTIDYLQQDINVLRNNICHNNFGTWRNLSILKKICGQNSGIEYSDDTLYFRDSQLIEDTLDKMLQVLHGVCDKLGYKNEAVPAKSFK